MRTRRAEPGGGAAGPGLPVERPVPAALAEQLQGIVALLASAGMAPLSARNDAAWRLVAGLHDLPLDPPLTAQQIAGFLGLKRKTVQGWLREHQCRRVPAPPPDPGGEDAKEPPAAARGRKPAATTRRGKRLVPAPAARRHPAYDAANMAVAQHPFFWTKAARRVIGLPYAEQAPWPVLVVIGVRDDGHVHLFWEDNSSRNGMAIANNIQELHTSAPVDAVVHTPPQDALHFRIARDLQNWQPLGTPPQDKFPLIPYTPGADLRPHLTRRLEAGRFTLSATLCPKTHAELQAVPRFNEDPESEGPFVRALCTVLAYLDQPAAV